PRGVEPAVRGRRPVPHASDPPGRAPTDQSQAESVDDERARGSDGPCFSAACNRHLHRASPVSQLPSQLPTRAPALAVYERGLKFSCESGTVERGQVEDEAQPPDVAPLLVELGRPAEPE